MTHDENGEPTKVTKYRGKISTGYGPLEPPNTVNSPVACGFYRMLKEIVKTQRIGREQKIVAVKEWVLNEPIQKMLESANNKSPQPRRVEVCCLAKEVPDMWESYLAKYSSSEGLLCKSHGKGTEAKQLIVGATDRKWEIRFPESGCLFHECPDFKAGKCKQMGLLKCFPVIDLAPNPYRFETRSINTIVGFESAFIDLTMLLRAAHMVKQIEAGKPLPYDGMFGAKLFLIHRKVKSGGRDVFITDIMPTPEFIDSVMEPIKRGLASKAKQSRMIGEAGAVSLLGDASAKLLEASKSAMEEAIDVEGAVPVNIDEQRDIAVQFPPDADEGDIAGDVVERPEGESIIPENLGKKAADTMLGEGVPKEK